MGGIQTLPTSKDTNAAILKNKLGPWASHAMQNRSVVKPEQALENIIGYCENKYPALILGPGPSLEFVEPYIGHYTRGKFMVCACNTALNPLIARGKVPDVIFAYDPAEAVGEQIEEYVDACPEEYRKDTILIAPVTIHPRVPKAWPHRIYWFVPDESTTPETNIFHETLAAQYPDITRMSNHSCVFMLMIAISHAILKAAPIFAAGFELPIRLGATYGCARYDLREPDNPIPLAGQHKEMTQKYVILHRRYVSALLGLIRSEGIPFVNLSPLASFRELITTRPPYTITLDPEEVASNGPNGI